ncbi:MAG: acyl-CoA dehydrogenase, partial [Chloroflexi bacterium]|nr:acyl-CoA dehydrogenase [Chloroflexota bacterium]
VQFGRPIGSFQAVHHHLADMYRDIVTSRLLTYQAAWRLGEGLPAAKEVSMAKTKLNYAYPAVTRMAHQIHGGVGYYTEYDLELYYRRALAGQVGYGDAPHHRELIAKELGI